MSDRDELNAEVNNPEEARPLAEWIESVGPEDETPDAKLDQIEQYGFDQMDEGFFDYEGDLAGDAPEWNDRLDAPTPKEQTIIQHNVNVGHFRAMEDEVLDAVDEGREPDDGESIPEQPPA